MTDRPDLATINARLAERMDDLAQHLAGEPTSRSRDELRFRGKGSLAVMIGGPKRGAWNDREAGCGGGPLGLVAHLRRTSMRDAYTWARAWLGDSRHLRCAETLARRVAPSAALPEAARPATLDLARRIWAEASKPGGTLAEHYLASRGLRVEPEAPLRFHPQCPRRDERWPALVALMSDPATGEPCGVHRTFLAPDGSGKAPGSAKMMAGNAGVIRLVPDAEVNAGLGIAEGIETSLSVMQCFGWRPVWAATSAGAIRRFPVLPGIEALTVFADPDGAGLEAARAGATRWANAGREARICAPPAGDFNDLARERAA